MTCSEAEMAEWEQRYADELRSETFGLPDDEITPASIRALEPVRGLKLIAREARLGGKLTGHLTRLTDEEHKERARHARAFLSRPPVEYPADDAAHRDKKSE
jgi:hypothetical protein